MPDRVAGPAVIVEHHSIMLRSSWPLGVAFAPLLDSGLEVEPGLFALCRRDAAQRLERHGFRVGLAAELE